MLKKGELKELWTFYTVAFLIGFTDLIGAYFVIYFLDKGFSSSQFSIFWSMLFFAPVFLEIPTGAVADYFGRKFSSILGIFLLAIGSFIVPSVNSFPILILLFFIWGGASTLISGAYEAWVVDLLRKKKKEHLIDEYYSKDNFIRNIGQICAPLIAVGLLLFYSMNIFWYVQGTGFIFSGLILLFFGKEYFKKPKWNLKKAYVTLIKNTKFSLKYCKNHYIIFWLIIGSMFFTVTMSLIMIIWQPLFKSLSIDVKFFGIIYSVMAVMGAVAGLFTKKIKSKFNKIKHFLIFNTTLLAICLLLFYFTKSISLSIILFVLVDIFATWKYIAHPVFFQKHVPSKQRATINSVNSLFMKLSSGMALIMGGYLLDIFTPQSILALSSILLIFAIMSYWKIKE